ncbi:hypothetical protein ACIQV3_11305 [Streptomyces sp. NPDC099050]|uniref:hypothetical protein n=1 Tax=Streptomyces sp. NPDC099050 TaxID=3366100 RepID=UPI0038201F9E
MTQHWHAYAYTGRAYLDGQVRKGDAPSNYPPFLVEDWLRRSPQHVETTFTDIEDAVTWLGKALAQYPPLDADSFPVAQRLEYARERLMEESGKDVVWNWYPPGQECVSRALIACPRPKRHQYADDSPPACPSPAQ